MVAFLKHSFNRYIKRLRGVCRKYYALPAPACAYKFCQNISRFKYFLSCHYGQAVPRTAGIAAVVFNALCHSFEHTVGLWKRRSAVIKIYHIFHLQNNIRGQTPSNIICSVSSFVTFIFYPQFNTFAVLIPFHFNAVIAAVLCFKLRLAVLSGNAHILSILYINLHASVICKVNR